MQHRLVAASTSNAPSTRALAPRSGRRASRRAWSGWAAITTRSKRRLAVHDHAVGVALDRARPGVATWTRSAAGWRSPHVHAAAADDRLPLRRVRDRQHAVVGEEADQVAGRERRGSCAGELRPDGAGQRQHEVVGEVVASSRRRRRNCSSVRPVGRRVAQHGARVAVEAPHLGQHPQVARPAEHATPAASRPASRARRRTRGRTPRSAPQKRHVATPACARPGRRTAAAGWGRCARCGR